MIMLASTRYPAITPSARPPLVIAHGLFGSARNWAGIARALAQHRDVVAVDMRNHGESPRSPSQGYEEMADDLARMIASLGGRADVLGHSMGGKAAMQLALRQADAVHRLIVADIAPVAYSHDHSAIIEALRGLDLDTLASRAEADRRLAQEIPERALRGFLLQSLDLHAAGGPRWRLNLEVLAASARALSGWPRVDGRFEGPALFVTGAESRYVLPEHHAIIRALFPGARFVTIAGAGHWLHAEQPGAFLAAVSDFLDG